MKKIKIQILMGVILLSNSVLLQAMLGRVARQQALLKSYQPSRLQSVRLQSRQFAKIPRGSGLNTRLRSGIQPQQQAQTGGFGQWLSNWWYGSPQPQVAPSVSIAEKPSPFKSPWGQQRGFSTTTPQKASPSWWDRLMGKVEEVVAPKPAVPAMTPEMKYWTDLNECLSRTVKVESDNIHFRHEQNSFTLEDLALAKDIISKNRQFINVRYQDNLSYATFRGSVAPSVTTVDKILRTIFNGVLPQVPGFSQVGYFTESSLNRIELLRYAIGLGGEFDPQNIELYKKLYNKLLVDRLKDLMRNSDRLVEQEGMLHFYGIDAQIKMIEEIIIRLNHILKNIPGFEETIKEATEGIARTDLFNVWDKNSGEKASSAILARIEELKNAHKITGQQAEVLWQEFEARTRQANQPKKQVGWDNPIENVPVMPVQKPATKQKAAAKQKAATKQEAPVEQVNKNVKQESDRIIQQLTAGSKLFNEAVPLQDYQQLQLEKSPFGEEVYRFLFNNSTADIENVFLHLINSKEGCLLIVQLLSYFANGPFTAGNLEKMAPLIGKFFNKFDESSQNQIFGIKTGFTNTQLELDKMKEAIMPMFLYDPAAFIARISANHKLLAETMPKDKEIFLKTVQMIMQKMSGHFAQGYLGDYDKWMDAGEYAQYVDPKIKQAYRYNFSQHKALIQWLKEIINGRNDISSADLNAYPIISAFAQKHAQEFVKVK